MNIARAVKKKFKIMCKKCEYYQTCSLRTSCVIELIEKHKCLNCGNYFKGHITYYAYFTEANILCDTCGIKTKFNI